jgi:hypothetical protein
VWSKNSVGSDNVRHEAKIAKDQGKLFPALIDDLPAEEFPMGLYVFQSAQLALWHGNPDDNAWLKVLRQIEYKLTPLWVVCHEDRRSKRRCATVREMKEGPSRPAVRFWPQTAASCSRQSDGGERCS